MKTVLPTNHKLANLPNLVTLARLVSAPALVLLAAQQWQTAFAVLLILALASDLLDGWLARRLEITSATGALLDSIADIALTLAILLGIWLLHPEVYLQDGWVIYSLTGAWILAHIASMLRYGKLASFHTWLIRVGIAAFNLFALSLFFFGYYPWMLYGVGTLSLLGVAEHFILLALLPQWSPDLQGGIPEALAKRKTRR